MKGICIHRDRAVFDEARGLKALSIVLPEATARKRLIFQSHLNLLDQCPRRGPLVPSCKSHSLLPKREMIQTSFAREYQRAYDSAEEANLAKGSVMAPMILFLPWWTIAVSLKHRYGQALERPRLMIAQTAKAYYLLPLSCPAAARPSSDGSLQTAVNIHSPQ